MRRIDPDDPAEQSRVFRLPGRASVRLRPIRPQDAGTLQAYLRRLAPESRRNRFLGALNELTPRELERIATMSPPNAVALLAFTGAAHDGTMIGEAIGVLAPGSARGEVALSVADEWQRRGLGMLLLQMIECRARAIGARHLFGDVLRTNTAMKGLARKAGFSIRSPFTDARLVEIVKDLSQAPASALCREESGALPSIAA